MLKPIFVFLLSLILLTPARALELDFLARWSWESLSQMEWLDDDEFVVACGSMLQFYSISDEGLLQKEHILELPSIPLDLSSQGRGVLVALGDRGFVRISYGSDGAPFVHHVNSMAEAGPELALATQIVASDEHGWFLTKSDDAISLWQHDPWGVETFHGYTRGIGSFQGPASMVFLDSTFVLGGTWSQGYYWGYQNPGNLEGAFELNDIIDGYAQYMAWDALCGRTLFTCSYVEGQFGMHRFDLSDPENPFLQEYSSTILGYYPVNWGCDNYFFTLLSEHPGIARHRIEATGFPIAQDSLFSTIYDLEFQGEYALGRGSAGRLLYLHTGGDGPIQILDSDVPSRISQNSMLGLNKIIRHMCGGIQVLSYHEESQQIEEDDYIPLSDICWATADENRLFLADDEQIYLLHECDSLGLANALTIPFEDVQELQILGSNLLGVRSSDAFTLLSVSDDLGFTYGGSIGDVGAEDVFAGSSRDLFQFLPDVGVVHVQLVDGVPGSSELIWSTETSDHPALLYCDGTLAIHASSDEPIVLLSHDEFGEITLLESPAESIDEILEFRGETLICKSDGTYFVQVGESHLNEILPGESVRGIHMQAGQLLVELDSNNLSLYDYWADPCREPHLSVDYRGSDIELTWSACAQGTGYLLEHAYSAYGPWEELMRVTQNHASLPIQSARDFYRVRVIF
jgi:hypothetical protein